MRQDAHKWCTARLDKAHQRSPEPLVHREQASTATMARRCLDLYHRLLKEIPS